MGRRRRRRTRSDSGGRRLNIEEGLPTFEHNQWTFEGEIERLGAFARGAARVTGPRRWLAVFVALVFVVPLAIGILTMLVRLIPR
jgi:hypothetical protein